MQFETQAFKNGPSLRMETESTNDFGPIFENMYQYAMESLSRYKM